jgi:hypothetical protein
MARLAQIPEVRGQRMIPPVFSCDVVPIPRGYEQAARDAATMPRCHEPAARDAARMPPGHKQAAREEK